MRQIRISTAALAAALAISGGGFAAEAGEPTLYFQTADYAVLMCKTPKLAAEANMISHGMPVTTDPSYDASWLKEQTGSKACIDLVPGQKFLVTPAIAVYVGSYGVEWVTGVASPEAPTNTLGYVPVDQISFIPIPTY